MAASMATMATLNTKYSFPNIQKNPNPNPKPSKPNSKPISLPKSLTIPITKTAIASAIFTTLSSNDAAFAAQQLADIAEGDNRGLALLLPIIPAIAWVLYNILQPALNQLNRMRTENAVIVGLGLGLGAMALVAPEAMAAEGSSDSRGQLLLIVITPAILWVLYNILQPALNQLNKMRSQ